MTVFHVLSIVAGLILAGTMAGLLIHMKAGSVRRYSTLVRRKAPSAGLGFADFYFDDPLGLESSLKRFSRLPSRRHILAVIVLINLVLALMVISAPDAFANAIVSMVDRLG